MLQIHCPYCRETREEEEFSCAGEAYIQRPPEPQSVSDQEWGDYLFFRKNPRGIHHEMWYHAVGCRRYFNVTRDTVSYQVLESYPMGSRPGVHAAEPGVSDSVGEPQ